MYTPGEEFELGSLRSECETVLGMKSALLHVLFLVPIIYLQ